MGEPGAPQSAAHGHELTRLFADEGLELNATLQEMLDEHFSHCTERRGCGFTQATRHLAALVNQPRTANLELTKKLFPSWFGSVHEASARVHRALPLLVLEESRLLAGIITDLLEPVGGAGDGLPTCFEAMKIGTCPLAEKYFLEIADGFVRRRGRANVIVGLNDVPLMIEKVGLGDDHSCVSVTELLLNGVRLPAGCLFGVQYAQSAAVRPNRSLPGSVVPLQVCEGFRFLRLTTLAVSPANRARAYTAHFQAQVAAGLFAPGRVTVEQLAQIAREQV